MAQLKAKDLVKLSKEELVAKLHELKSEKIKVGVVNNQEKNTATLVKNIKRNIARILTVIRIKEL